MEINFNDNLIELPKEIITVEDLINWKNIPISGTAVAINNQIIRKSHWNTTSIKENDKITIITAAYGG